MPDHNRVQHALTLMAEAAAHSINILYSRRDIGISFHRRGWESIPRDLTTDLEAYANEIWAILHAEAVNRG